MEEAGVWNEEESGSAFTEMSNPVLIELLNSYYHCESHPTYSFSLPRFLPQHSGDRAGGKVQETSETVILGFSSGCGDRPGVVGVTSTCMVWLLP